MPDVFWDLFQSNQIRISNFDDFEFFPLLKNRTSYFEIIKFEFVRKNFKKMQKFDSGTIERL